jgi:hypothetical protein
MIYTSGFKKFQFLVYLAVVKGPKNNKRRMLWINKTVSNMSNFEKYRKTAFYKNSFIVSGDRKKSKAGIHIKMDTYKAYSPLYW